MNKYQGTQTEKNLQAAYAGESQARNKYTYFSSVAKKEGYEQIAAIFLKTADNEKEHAKMWFKVRISSGLICMKILRQLQRMRDSLNWRRNSVWLERSKSIMRKDTANC